MDPRVGTTVGGRYRINERWSEGGMGAVYLGEHTELGRPVAIKFLHAWAASDASFVQRFEREAQAMARLHHPGCAQVLDVGVDAGAPFVVMEFVAGESLLDLLDRGPVAPARALEITRQILAALAHAHAQGVIHRDIKPANVMVSASEFGDQVKVLDFGLARLRAATSDLTGPFAVGTPTYMPPEQSVGAPVDERTDLYAVGVVLFELITGAPPFQHADPASVIAAHRSQPPPLLSERLGGGTCSPALERAVMRALAKHPEDRYPSAGEMARALAATPEAGGPRPSDDAAAATAPATPPPAPAPPTTSGDGTMVLGTDALIPIEPAAPPATAAAPPSQPRAATPPPPAPPVSVARPTPAPPPRWQAWLRRHWYAAVGGACVLIGVIALAASSRGGGAPARRATAAEAAPPADPPADPLAGLRARLRGPDTDDEVVHALVRLATRAPGDAEAALAVGDIYCQRLWVRDCLPMLRRALTVAPALRDDPRVGRAAVHGLGADGSYADVQRFLVRELGAAARPALEEVAAGRWRREVKDRAAATARELDLQLAK